MSDVFETLEEKYLDDILRNSEIYATEYNQKNWLGQDFYEAVAKQRTIARKFIKSESDRTMFLAMMAERHIDDALRLLKLLTTGDKIPNVEEEKLVSLYFEFKKRMADFSITMLQMRDAYLKNHGHSFSSETEGLRRTAVAIRKDFPWLAGKFDSEADNIDFRNKFIEMMESENAKE